MAASAHAGSTIGIPIRGGLENVAPDAKWLYRRWEGEETCYENAVRWWTFLRQCRRGGRSWKNGRNLPPHILETETSSAGKQLLAGASGGGGAPGVKTRTAYELRLEQLGRYNLVDDVLTPYDGYLATNPPTRPGLPTGVAGLEDFVERADLSRGKSLTDVMAGTGSDAIHLGTAWAGVGYSISTEKLREAAASDGKPVDERPDGIRVDSGLVARLGDAALPYVYTVAPEDMLLVHVNAVGKPVAALVREKRATGAGLESGEPGEELVFRHWTLERWVLYRLRKDPSSGRVTKEEVESGENKYGQVNGRLALFPLQPWDGDDPMQGRSKVDDIALIDRMLADILSSFTFNGTNSADLKVSLKANLAALKAQFPVEAQFLAEVDKMVDAALAPVAVFSHDTEVTNQERSFAQGALLLDAFERLYRLALQSQGLGDLVDDATGAGAESGIAKFRSFQILDKALVHIGKHLQRLELEILRAAAFFLGGSAAMKQVKADASIYPSSYDVADVASLVAMREALDGKAPDEVLNWITSQIMRKAFPNRSPKVVEEHEAALTKFKAPDPMADLLGKFGAEAGAPGSGDDEEEPAGGKPPGQPPRNGRPPFPPRRGPRPAAPAAEA